MSEGSLFALPIVNQNRDPDSEEGKIDWRSRLRVTMGEEGLFLLPIVNQNRDLISKKEDRHKSATTSTIGKFDREEVCRKSNSR